MAAAGRVGIVGGERVGDGAVLDQCSLRRALDRMDLAAHEVQEVGQLVEHLLEDDIVGRGGDELMELDVEVEERAAALDRLAVPLEIVVQGFDLGWSGPGAQPSPATSCSTCARNSYRSSVVWASSSRAMSSRGSA